MANDKKREKGFDLLTTDGYEVTENNEIDSQEELELNSYELSTQDLEEFESDFKNEEDPLTPVEHSIVSLEENRNEQTENKSISRDINSMFEKASSSVQEAKNIFAKNVEMKRQIDEKFQELERAKIEHERENKANVDKINTYKESVVAKLREKKNEIGQQVVRLKEAQGKYAEEKMSFETYKKEELEKLKTIKREQRQELEERKKELDLLTDSLKQQRDEIEEEKRQLELDRIRYEADKNELANNLLKFNELVGDFTVNIDKFNN